MKESEAVKLVAALAAAFPNRTIEEPTINVYVKDLLDLDAAATAAACEGLRKTAPFFPTIAEIRTAVAQMTLNAPSASAAWEQAAGPGPRHELVDRARRRVGDAWDWRTTEQRFLRRPFLDAYAEVLHAAELEIVAPVLARPSRAIEAGPRREIGQAEPSEKELVEMPREELERWTRRAEPEGV